MRITKRISWRNRSHFLLIFSFLFFCGCADRNRVVLVLKDAQNFVEVKASEIISADVLLSSNDGSAAIRICFDQVSQIRMNAFLKQRFRKVIQVFVGETLIAAPSVQTLVSKCWVIAVKDEKYARARVRDLR